MADFLPGAVRRFSRNPLGRDLIVGDVHGCFSALQAALDEAGFNPFTGDRLFSVGDLVDRGPESAQALAWLDKPWFFAVRGNHEDMAIDWAAGVGEAGWYAGNGGAWNIANLQQERLAFADAFAALPVAIELETDGGLVGIVHAGCPYSHWRHFCNVLEGAADAERAHAVAMALWSRQRPHSGDRSPVAGVRVVVCGHTSTEVPVVLGNTVFIDTAGWHPDGPGFTLLDAGSLEARLCRDAHASRGTIHQ